jgi:PPOX class probable F420-dependent enzyme
MKVLVAYATRHGATAGIAGRVAAAPTAAGLSAQAVKVKRIRRNPQVRVAVCTASGRLRGEQVPAVAEILPDSEIGAVERLIAAKYRLDMIIFRPVRFVQARLHLGRPRTEPAILGITPS